MTHLTLLKSSGKTASFHARSLFPKETSGNLLLPPEKIDLPISDPPPSPSPPRPHPQSPSSDCSLPSPGIRCKIVSFMTPATEICFSCILIYNVTSVYFSEELGVMHEQNPALLVPYFLRFVF